MTSAYVPTEQSGGGRRIGVWDWDFFGFFCGALACLPLRRRRKMAQPLAWRLSCGLGCPALYAGGVKRRANSSSRRPAALLWVAISPAVAGRLRMTVRSCWPFLKNGQTPEQRRDVAATTGDRQILSVRETLRWELPNPVGIYEDLPSHGNLAVSALRLRCRGIIAMFELGDL